MGIKNVSHYPRKGLNFSGGVMASWNRRWDMADRV
jgi:hypothetical protein